MRKDTHDEHRKYQKLGNIADSDKKTEPLREPIREPRLNRLEPRKELPKLRRTPPSPGPRYHVPKEQRVVMAIDVQNLYYAAKDYYNTKVDYGSLMKTTLNGRQLVRSIAYMAYKPTNAQAGFVEFLRGLGCDIKQKSVTEVGNGKRKCNWDVEIAVDAMAMIEKIDTFILASGDGDFTYLLRVLKANGIRTEVVSCRPNTSQLLVAESDIYTDIDSTMLIDERSAWLKREAYYKQKEAKEKAGEGISGSASSTKKEGLRESTKSKEDWYEEPNYDSE